MSSPSDLRVATNAWLRKILAGRSFGTVLNLGCGTDKDFEGSHYSDYFGWKKLIKMDPDPTLPPNVIKAKAEEIPLPAHSVDFIFMHWVFYKTCMSKALEEICRVLKPKGLILISWADPSEQKVARIRRLLLSRIRPVETFAYVYFVKGENRRAELMLGELP